MHFHIHHYVGLTVEVLNRLDETDRALGLVLQNQESLMIDTSRILAEVARARTELGSWQALATALTKTIADQAAALKSAIAANDPAAMAQVQADLDTAATGLSADNDAAAAALVANTPAATPAAVPPGAGA